MADTAAEISASSCPAIVLGVETQIGLALVRELGRAGVRVVAISDDPNSIGFASRYAWRRELCQQPRSEALIQLINRLARELGPLSLLTVSEGNLKWLNSVRRRLDTQVHMAVPSAATLNAVLDKSQTLSAAQRVGLEVPRTAVVASLAEWCELAPNLSYPVVLKWQDSNAVAKHLSAAALPLVKAEYVYSVEGFLDVGKRYAPVGQWPMIQAYCPGYGLGQFFFMHRGLPVRCFQHRRIAEWPPEGGYSSVCDSLPTEAHAKLQQSSISLLQELRWDGVAMVEYRHDPVTGRSVLMEINGRFWGSLPLAVAAGVGFALFAHAAALDAVLPQLPPPRVGVRCRMVATEIKRLRRIWLQPQLIADRTFVRRPIAELLRFAADFLRPGVRYFVWAADDPCPALRDLKNALRLRR